MNTHCSVAGAAQLGTTSNTRRPEFLWNPTRDELVTTKFMRNRVLFSTLAQDVLSRLRNEKNRPLRLLFWGCSIGCEPFTLKLLLGPDSKDEIIGIDQDPDAIRQACLGIYHPDSWTMFFDRQRTLLTESEVNRLFEPVKNGASQSFRVAECYRQNISFLTGDLFSADPVVPLKGFDVVVCNNLLLHLKPDSASLACDCLYKYLDDDGLLVIGGCNPSIRAAAAKRLNLTPYPEKLAEISKSWCGVSGAWNFNPRPAWAWPEPRKDDPDYKFLAGEIFSKSPTKETRRITQQPLVRPKNIIISGTNFWNPGDDFVRDGVIRILRDAFGDTPLNFLFYNFNPDVYPNEKLFAGSNIICSGDLEKFNDSVDAVVVVGVSAGHELKPLYRWVLANGLADKVYLISGHYESGYCEEHICQEPEATIFRKARLVIGRTRKHPEFIRSAGIPYHHVNCPALLSVPEVKVIAPGKKVERIGFSIQLPRSHGGLVNQCCAEEPYQLAVAVLNDLASQYQVEVVAHHKTEYFHFLNLLRGTGIPVIFSSFYPDFFATYRRYDLVVTTRLHASLFANGHGIPGIIINDTDRHTHALEGFPHSPWVNTREAFEKAMGRWQQADLSAVAREADSFKAELLARYVQILRPLMTQTNPASAIADDEHSELNGSAVLSDLNKLADPLDGVQRILFVRTDSIGDALLASSMLPHLRARFPGARLAVLCQDQIADLYLPSPCVDTVICFNRQQITADQAYKKQILDEIQEFCPDLVLSTVYSRDALTECLALSNQAPHKIAIAGDTSNITAADRDRFAANYTYVVPSPGLHKNELERHRDFLAGIGISVDLLQPLVWTTKEDEELAKAFFQEHKLDSQRVIALFPGARFDVRVYPKYADALQGLQDYQFLIFGGPEVETLGNEIGRHLPGKVFNLAGRTTIREMAGLMRRCRLYVGAESAGAHLACAVGLPNVVVTGGGHFGRFLPYSPLTSAAVLPLNCFGCNWQCSQKRAHCIKDIAPEVLAQAIHHTLAKSSTRPRVFVQNKASWRGGMMLPSWQSPDLWLNGMEAEVIEVSAEPVHSSPVARKEDLLSDIEIVGSGIANPLVSVVVSAYQSEKFIGACLENLSHQTIFDRCEVIVVDSGSPENERAVVARFQERFPNIRYVRTLRETLYGAWNRGLALARGRYWANLNTDDSLRNDALEIFAGALDKNSDCALAYSDTAWTTKPNDTFPSVNIVKTVKYPDYAPLETLFYCITGCVQFFRTECLRQLGGFDATLHCAGDYEATLKIMSARKNAVHVPEVLSLFYQNTSGLTQGSNRAALEHEQVMNQYRERLDVGNIFQVEPAQVNTVANALAALSVRAARFSVPWESAPMAHNDFAIACLSQALNRDPENAAAGMNLVALNSTLQRLNSAEAELVRRWPRMRTWIDRFRAGESAQVAPVKHTLLGPVYRPSEWSLRPTLEQLAHEPGTLRPWICRIDGRHVYLSEDLFPRPGGLGYAPAELQQAAKRLVGLMADLPPFYAHFGGAGDALLLLASFYDKNPEAVIFSHPNSVGGTRALFEAFPKLTKIYFLPQHTEFFFHMVLRYAVYELKNCLGAGATPRDGYEDEWKATLDIEKKYRINKTPRWAAALRQNDQSRRVALAPKGSLSGMIGSKRNIIPPEDWSRIISCILERRFEPVILGVPSEAKDYPALPGCIDARVESFTGQMKLIGQCAGVVGADSWAKTFSALAGIPTIVFEPLRGADLCSWKDASDWVFIEPWPAIKMVKSLEEFRSTFDLRIARTKQPIATQKPMIAWEGSFLDHGSLSHINRELTARLTGKVDLACIGRNGLPSAIQSDSALQTFAQKLLPESPRNVAVTVRHQWPPKWSRPASGALVVVQPWEFGALPKAWVEASANVDEFWVPSALVRAMYVDSGIAPEKVRVFANGVDSKKFRPGLKPMALATKKKFKFLFVGGTIFRKGPDVLLAAFCDAFNASDDVCLVIKDFGGDSFYTGQTAQDAIRQAQEKPNAPEILHLKQELTAAQMPSLYAACDCLVSPYRGEGFGMPVLEAMACGLPVIVTAGGATDSFVSPEAGWKIASQGRRLGCRVGEMELVKEGWLLEPSRSHLTAILKLAVQHPQECRRRGACGRQTVERRFEWDDIAAAIAHRLNELGERALANGQVLSNPAKPASNGSATSHPNSAPPVVKIGDLRQARAAFAAKDFESAWKEASSAILQRPAHPDAFLLLAETAATFGDAALVHSCLQQARKLAPGRKPARPVVRKASQKTPEWMVSPKARVRASRPDNQLAARLTVCVIARNEQQNLARCLSSIKDLASQIVVVDTGSTDRTIEIARSLAAEIYEFAWCDDFSAARNAALEHARGDWVLILDADEELPPDQHARLRVDLENDKVIALRLPLVNEGQEAEGRTCVPRLFRNAPGVYFSGRIHEQVFTSLVALGKEWGLGTAVGTAQILHHGYTQEAVKDRNKVERNLKLLRLAVEENPNDLNLAMNLGLELVRSGDLDTGLVHYRRAFDLMTSRPAGETSPELREALLTQFTSHLYKVRAHKEVVEILTSAGGNTPGLTASLHFALGLACFELGRYGESAEQMRQCLARRRQSTLSPINTDILTAAPYHCLALSLAKTGDLAAAEKAFQTGLDEKGHSEEIRLDYARFLGENNRAVDAVHKLHEIVVANPKCIKAWRDGGQLALGQSEFLEFACDWTSEAIQQFPEDGTIIAQRAEALFLNEQIAQALPLWQTLLKRGPQPRWQAALTICELLEHGAVTSGDVYEAELGPIGRAVVEWYQCCLSMRTRTIVNLLNERLAGLRSVLPAVADMIEAALNEARSESGAAVEPCLV